MKSGPSRLDRRIAGFAGLARVVLWIESLTAAFWPAATLIGVFVILAIFGIPTALPAWLHLLFLLAVSRRRSACRCVGLAAALRVSGARSCATQGRARQRAASSSVRDAGRPACRADDDATASLWRLYQERRRAEIGQLRVAFPQAGLPERDPWALRFLVVITLVLGFVVAGPRAGRLVLAALSPQFAGAAATVPVEAWVKPPAYTGLAPILLKNDDDKPVAVPIGSTLEAHVTGGSRTPRLILDDVREDFRHIDGGGFALTRTISTPGTLSIGRGWSTLSRWQIAIIPDKLPVVEFSAPPSAMQSGAIKFDYHATDDYGVAAIEFRARPVPGQPDVMADPIAVSLASGQTEKELRGSSFQDLTEHPWAGMQVLVKLVATDTGGQTSESTEAVFRLPERRFVNADGDEHRQNPQARHIRRRTALPAGARTVQSDGESAGHRRGPQRLSGAEGRRDRAAAICAPTIRDAPWRASKTCCGTPR